MNVDPVQCKAGNEWVRAGYCYGKMILRRCFYENSKALSLTSLYSGRANRDTHMYVNIQCMYSACQFGSLGPRSLGPQSPDPGFSGPTHPQLKRRALEAIHKPVVDKQPALSV